MHRLSTLVVALALAAVTVPAALVAAMAAESAEPATGETTAQPTSEPNTTNENEQRRSFKRSKAARAKLARNSPYLVEKIKRHRNATWRWQDVMGKPRAKFAFSRAESRGKYHRQWVLRVWKKRHAEARRQAQSPPNRYAWLCLQRHEGAWGANTGNGYYGGLQMDWSFMRAYGSHLLRRKGPASNWTPLEQMWVAERALRSGRGFYPWPNTARMCGLL